MNESAMADQRIGWLASVTLAAWVLLTALAPLSAFATKEDLAEVLAEAEAFVHQNTLYLALERLSEAARLAPGDYRIPKLRGDVLMSFRRNEEAVAAYREAAALAPDALDVHWALRTLLDRMGAHHRAIASLREIVRLEPDNPLAHLRLAKALSQVDRLEEAVLSFRRAVDLTPDNLAIRLQFARALYDVLNTAGARQQVDMVLARAEVGSPEWASAQDLLSHLRGESFDKGRRFDQSQTLRQLPRYTERNLKEAVLARGEAWQLMEQGRYADAEGSLRKALSWNPEDHRAIYDLGLTLMELGRYEEAIASFRKGVELAKFAEFYPDSVFQMGRCLAKLGRRQEAIAQFERVLEIRDWRHEDFYALNFPDLAKVQEALDEARQQVAIAEQAANPEPPVVGERLGPEPYEYPIPPLANGHQLIESILIAAQLTPIGTETVRGAFRQVITARDVIQDDLQAGWHEFIPVNPTDTFLPQEPDIYVVFLLTGNQETLELKLTSRWIAEQTKGFPPNTLVGTDAILLGLNERSGYFRLHRPENGWSPGIYRVDLYLGLQVSAYTHVADLRFRIVRESHPPQKTCERCP
jgi:tetratricopeptide (TPR) repeat protein